MLNNFNYPLLKGLKVVELEGYLPVAFLGKILHDIGAEVYLIKPIKENEIMKVVSHLHNGKKEIKLNLKDENNLKILKKIIQQSDILIDGYRPGVLEKLNLDPKILLLDFPQLIVIRVTGYGQTGLMSLQPGHDINYLSLSGVLDFFKTEDNKIVNPMIILGDIFCGSLMPVFHISQALLNRELNGGKGCIIDSAITTNLLSLSAITNKLSDNTKFYFTCTCINYEYVLFYIHNDEKLNFNLKKICERLFIEVINISTIDESTRLKLTRDYIDLFQLITKSTTDSIKCIKDLCKMLTHEDVIKNLKKLKFVEVYPIFKFVDLLNFIKDPSKILINKESFSTLDVLSNDEIQVNNRQFNYQENKNNMIDILKNFDISETDLSEYVKNNKNFKSKY